MHRPLGTERKPVRRWLAVCLGAPVDLEVVDEQLAEQRQRREPHLEVRAEQAVHLHVLVVFHQQAEVEHVGEPRLEGASRAGGHFPFPHGKAGVVSRPGQQPVRDEVAVIENTGSVRAVVQLGD